MAKAKKTKWIYVCPAKSEDKVTCYLDRANRNGVRSIGHHPKYVHKYSSQQPDMENCGLLFKCVEYVEGKEFKGWHLLVSRVAVINRKRQTVWDSAGDYFYTDYDKLLKDSKRLRNDIKIEEVWA